MPGYTQPNMTDYVSQLAQEKQKKEAERAQKKQELMGYLNLIPVVGGLAGAVVGAASGGTAASTATGATAGSAVGQAGASGANVALSQGAATGGGPAGGLKPEFTGGSPPGIVATPPRAVKQNSSLYPLQQHDPNQQQLYYRLASQYLRGY